MLTLASRWKLGDRFRWWIEQAVPFPNTLVDRIVPGTPDTLAEVESDLGYRDGLLTVAEAATRRSRTPRRTALRQHWVGREVLGW